MIRAILVDDEEHCRTRLSSLLSAYSPEEILLMAEATSVEEGLTLIKKLRPDLVFLDVQIHNRTGFQMLEELGELPFDVVFTTAYEKFAVQAFRFSAFDFLLKPIDEEELRGTIDKIQQKGLSASTVERINSARQNYDYASGKSGKIAVPTMSGITMLDSADIVRCESDVNYTTIYTEDKKKITVAKTLKDFEEMLSKRGFYRLHNSHLVNLSSIKEYKKGKGGSVLLKDGTELEVSVRRKDELLQLLMSM